MSDQLFGDGKEPVTPAATPPQTDPQKNYLEELVGDDKKFKSVEDLAKSKAESDAFIEQLKRENAGLRTDLNSRLAVEQFVDQVIDSTGTKPQENQNPQPSSVITPEPNQVTETKKDEITPEQLNELVNQALETRLSEEKKKANVDDAMQSAINKFGQENFRSELSKKANELGLGTQFLASIAEQNPATFKQLMGLNDTAPSESNVQPGSQPAVIDSEGAQRVTPSSTEVQGKSYAEYEKLRETNPTEYWSPRVQNEMFKAIQEQGESFYT